ncbi:hypothetical protein [Blastococcus xanthinilyticus]|uniref:Lumazine-binding protein n=1 Tax=Blastococcus xanthinilyticus TaxID=1564164 RepID=A0A5S5CZQ1_9ACTN|nr:hypothetical protein [Blastococcus xanthinilyticus]TYP87859.1 hypothetical protein BD833_10530 [Blastococcus xanthinilyticus]
MARNARLFLLAPAVALVTGCGGGFEDVAAIPGEEGASRVAETYLAALADGDGPRACSLMDTATQQTLIGAHGGTGDCLAAVKGAAEALSSAQKEELSGAELGEVAVDGNSASVRVELAAELAALAGADDGVLALARQEGHWGITG